MKTWYVSTTGDNDTAGSETAPFRSIQYAIDKAQPDDEIIVEDGIYREAVNINKSVTVKARNRQKAIIDGGYNQKLRGNKSFVGYDGKAVAGGCMPSPVAANISKGNWKANGSGAYSPLVTLTGNYSTLDGFVVRNSFGRGLTLVGDFSSALNCWIDFTYSHALRVGGNSKSDICEAPIVYNCTVTRGSLRAFDPTRSYGGTPMGVDSCAHFMFTLRPIITKSIVAYNLGEGIGLGKGTTDAIVSYNLSFGNLHANFYGNGGATRAKVYGNSFFDPLNVAPHLEACGLNMFDNVVFGDEEENWQSGPGLEFYYNVVAGNHTGQPFTISGWNGLGNFPRPFILRGCIVHNVIVSGKENSGLALFGSSVSEHGDHKGIIANNIFLNAPGVPNGITVQKNGKRYQDVAIRNNLGNIPFPADFAGEGNKVTNLPILANPFADILVPDDFDLFAEETFDPQKIGFNLRNYSLADNSPATGMAWSGTANGFTPPVTYEHAGAPIMAPEPPVEPPDEPDPPVEPPDEPDPPVEPPDEPEPALANWREWPDQEWRDFINAMAGKLVELTELIPPEYDNQPVFLASE